ncbi:ankyrin and het domain protein [Stagonosporopsis vannaccii]|nr:ankyrin and het domain protein [Stagonosporopsis vannaccii]
MRLRSLLSQVRFTQRLPFLLGNYVYQPLPTETSIRLLELIPSTDNNRIRCSLKIYELDDAPTFKALSYTWGHSDTTIARSSALKEDITNCLNHHRAAKYRQLENDTDDVGRKRQHHIICDDRLMRVTSNLRDALHMLGNAINLPLMSKIPVYYWVDALCMDQGNVLERNSQVARMADIFRKASGVIVWLGREDDYTADALEVIRKVSEIPMNDWSNVHYTSFYDSNAAEYPYKPDLTYYNWLGFIALVNRPWFRRAWVVQEITLGKSPIVVCGSKVFPWERLSRTLSFIKATKWYHHLQTEKMKHVAELQKYPGVYKQLLESRLSVGMSSMFLNETRVAVATGSSFDQVEKAQLPFTLLLQKHRYSKSTDPRDKVYAFLGLASSAMAPFRTDPAAITPDYSRSVQQVYLATAKALLTNFHNLSVLSHVEDHSIRRTTGLPSWVPDYSVSLDPYPLRYRGRGHWMASGYTPWRMNVPKMDNGLLDVQGCRLGYIDETSILSDESNDPSASWASIVKLALALELPYPNPSGVDRNLSRVEILWRTLTTDTYARACPAPPQAGLLFIDYILNLQIRHRLVPWSSSDEFQPHHAPLSESIYPEWRTLLRLEPSGSAYSLDAYKERLTAVVEDMFNGTYSPIGLAQLQHELDQSGGRKRRLFRTRGSYLGTGSRSLKPGDEIWILRRGDLPFVLRPQPTFGHYRLVGEAFVYGIMHGEASNLDLPLQNITLE